MSANPQPMISVSDLVVSYSNYVAVKGISFDVRRGEHITLFVDCQGHRVTIRRPPTDIIAKGEEVTLLFSPEHAVLLER